MDVTTIVFTLVLMIFKPDGGYASELYPVTVPVCQTVNGMRVEDSKCGIRACLRMGEKRAAVIWGRLPGSTFAFTCNADNGEAAKKAAPAGGGHPALHFE